MSREKSKRSKSSERSTFYAYKRLFTYIKSYGVHFFFAIVANLFDGGLSAFFTYLIKPILDKGFIDRDPAFIRFLPFLIVILFLLRGVANFVSNYSMAAVSQGVIMRLQQVMFGHFQILPAQYYDHTNSGTMLSAMIYNIGQLSKASADAITTFLQSLGMIIGLLIVMFSISWQLTVIYFIALPIIMCVVYLTSMRTRRISLKIQKSMARVVSVAQENIEGYKVVRAFGAQAHEREKFKNFTNLNRLGEMKNVINKSISVMLVQIVAAIVLAITVYLASSNHAGHLLSAGGFMSIIAAMLAILKPMKDLTNVNNTIQRGVAGAQSVFNTLDLPAEQDHGTVRATRVRGDVSFENINFSYTSSAQPALKNISLHVPAGSCVALVGHSGSGKTTLMNLLPRFYQVSEGCIKIDGIDIRDYQLQSLREQFALVSQDVTLFDESVANNISYGQFDCVDSAKIIAAARLAHADEFIRDMKAGYDTLIGEDGVLLSGGQRQRIAIARAIFKNAPILIFDEATSALDTESERFIQEGLEALKVDRTTFIIAHRLSTIEHADIIVVMSEGSIVEVGDHFSLIAKNGHYAKLHRLQFKD